MSSFHRDALTNQLHDLWLSMRESVESMILSGQFKPVLNRNEIEPTCYWGRQVAHCGDVCGIRPITPCEILLRYVRLWESSYLVSQQFGMYAFAKFNEVKFKHTYSSNIYIFGTSEKDYYEHVQARPKQVRAQCKT